MHKWNERIVIFAILFYLFEHLPYYDEYVKNGKYAGDRLFAHFERNFNELCGKALGIYEDRNSK